MAPRRKLELVLLRALEKSGLPRGATLVVACSGGPDSTALLHALLAIQPATHLQLHVAHLNHDFRGQEAEDDAEFVAEMAAKLNLPATIDEADPIAYQRERGVSSFEEAAREVRYRFLTNLANRIDAHAIALGHTADDQAETILMHILRGTGLPGLRGMQELTPWRDTPNGQPAILFRPLLEATRHDTRAYCLDLNIPFREDSTNRSLRFTRNRVRLKLIPALREYNPQVRDALIRLGRAAAESHQFLADELDAHRPNIFSKQGRTVTLNAAALRNLHPALRSLALRRAYAEASGSPRRLSESHVKAMIALSEAPPTKTVHLPGGLAMQSAPHRLIICPLEQQKNADETPDYEYPLNMPGTTRIPGWRISIEPAPSTLDPKTLPPTDALFDSDKIGKNLVVRNRRQDDYFQPLGMSGRKKLKDLFIDLKIPRELRPSTPLLVSEKGVLWVYPYRTSEKTKIDATTKRSLLVRWEAAD